MVTTAACVKFVPLLALPLLALPLPKTSRWQPPQKRRFPTVPEAPSAIIVDSTDTSSVTVSLLSKRSAKSTSTLLLIALKALRLQISISRRRMMKKTISTHSGHRGKFQSGISPVYVLIRLNFSYIS